MTDETDRGFYERHPKRNEKIRREFWYGVQEHPGYGVRVRQSVRSLAWKYDLSHSRIYEIVRHQPITRMGITRAELLVALLPGLNALFGWDYEYGEGQGDDGEEDRKRFEEIVNNA